MTNVGVVRSALVSALLVAACAAPAPRPTRAWTDSFEFQITTDPSPLRAREPIIFHVTVLDRKTREFVQNGEGRIFATSRDRANRWDSFEPTAEPGQYTARMNFITAGDWNVNLQFRRDSTQRLEKPVDDLVYTIRGARPMTERPATAAPAPAR